MQSRKHATSLCVCGLMGARSVNLTGELLAAYMYITVAVKAHACTSTHRAVLCARV